jgi:hypothetical protein
MILSSAKHDVSYLDAHKGRNHKVLGNGVLVLPVLGRREVSIGKKNDSKSPLGIRVNDILGDFLLQQRSREKGERKKERERER